MGISKRSYSLFTFNSFFLDFIISHNLWLFLQIFLFSLKMYWACCWTFLRENNTVSSNFLWLIFLKINNLYFCFSYSLRTLLSVLQSLYLSVLRYFSNLGIFSVFFVGRTLFRHRAECRLPKRSLLLLLRIICLIILLIVLTITVG